MAADNQKKYDGKLVHRGAEHSSPYPVSRLAPAIELVDLAREVAQADNMLTGVATGKLRVIAEQMRALQTEAKNILTAVQRDQDLHRVACQFKRQPGRFYHLYLKPSGERYFSLLSPQEWGNPPHQFLGSYRLEADMSWTPATQAETPDETRWLLQQLLNATPHER